MSIMEEEALTAMKALALSPTTSSNNNNLPRRAILDGEIRQLFSLPDSIIYYIAMNPSSAEVYNKLIRTCKYFYNINPILVVNQFCFWKQGFGKDVHEDVSDEDKSDSGDDEPAGDEAGNDEPVGDEAGDGDVNPLELEGGNHDWRIAFKKCYPANVVDMNKVPFKFWMTEDVSIFPCDDKHEYAAASIVPKIYRCDATGFVLRHQVLTLDDFCLLASNSKEILLINVTITESDGKNAVMFEKVVEGLPNIRKLFWFGVTAYCACCGVPDDRVRFSSATVTELLKIEHFGNIEGLRLRLLPEVFDGKALFDSIKMKHKNMKVYLEYGAPEISDRCKEQIDKIVDEVTSTEAFTYMPPFICYPEIDSNKLKKMDEIQSRYENTQF